MKRVMIEMPEDGDVVVIAARDEDGIETDQESEVKIVIDKQNPLVWNEECWQVSVEGDVPEEFWADIQIVWGHGKWHEV